MIGYIAGGVAIMTATGLCGFGFLLAKRVVSASARSKLIDVEFAGSRVSLPSTDKTTAQGEYHLSVVGGPVVRIGAVVGHSDGRVTRQVLSDTAETLQGRHKASWSAHGYAGPSDVGEHSTVEIPTSSGETREAWLFPGDPSHWTIHVQGVRTTRGVTLRSVAIAREVGATALAITYRGSGDGPAARAATLGAIEWSELSDAVSYARTNGARRVTVVAWSMGAALALELVRRSPRAVDDLVLLCPVSDWPMTIEYGARRAGLPRLAASLASLMIRNRFVAGALGLPAAIDVRSLSWTQRGSVPIPAMVVHSQGDEVVPWETTIELVRNNPDIELVESVACPHGFELTVPDASTRAAVRGWLINKPESLTSR